MATSDNETTLDRRRLIQAGVASGIAAAAWSSPLITSSSVVAFDGTECTAPTIDFSSGKENANCKSDCISGSQLYISYGNQGNSALKITIPVSSGNIVLEIARPACSLNQPTYTIDLPPSIEDLYVCEVSSVTVFRASDPAGGTVVPATLAGRLPEIQASAGDVADGSGNCNVFVNYNIECCPIENYNG